MYYLIPMQYSSIRFFLSFLWLLLSEMKHKNSSYVEFNFHSSLLRYYHEGISKVNLKKLRNSLFQLYYLNFSITLICYTLFKLNSIRFNKVHELMHFLFLRYARVKSNIMRIRHLIMMVPYHVFQ